MTVEEYLLSRGCPEDTVHRVCNDEKWAQYRELLRLEKGLT